MSATTKPKAAAKATPKPKVLGVGVAKTRMAGFAASITKRVVQGMTIDLENAIDLARAYAVQLEQPKALKADQSFTDWAKESLDVSQPRIDSLRRAGTVALIVGPENIPVGTSPDVLDKLHKVLNDSTVATRNERIGNVQRLWAKVVRKAGTKVPRIWMATQLVGLEYPHLAKSGSRGPTAGTPAAAGNGSDTKARKAGRKVAPAKSQEVQVPEVPNQALTEFRTKASHAALLKVRTSIAPESWATSRVLMVAIVDLCEKYGVPNVRAAMDQADLAAPKAPKARRTAAKPKATQQAPKARATKATK